jgi:hypothetical protein
MMHLKLFIPLGNIQHTKLGMGWKKAFLEAFSSDLKWLS